MVQIQIEGENLFVPDRSVPFSMEGNFAIWHCRGKKKTAIDENGSNQTELNNSFVSEFFNRNSGARQRRFTMILLFILVQLSTISCSSLLLNLQKKIVLITQKIILFRENKICIKIIWSYETG